MDSIKQEFPDRIDYVNENGLLHREVSPAREWITGLQKGSWEWWFDGSPHRKVGAAAIYNSINKDYRWYVNGFLHNINAPAHESSDGVKIWYNSGARHRVGGPAWYSLFKDFAWWKLGQRHRLNAPAVIYNDNEGNDNYYFEFGNLVKPGKPDKLIERISELKDAKGIIPQIKQTRL